MLAPLKVTGGVGLGDTTNPILQTITLATSGGYIFESSADNIVAGAGGGQFFAVPLTSEVNRITGVVSAGDSVFLPPSVAGLTVFIINHGLNSMQVYGSLLDTIDDVAAATGVAQMINSNVVYTCATSGKWYSNGLGTGYAGQYPTVSFINGLVASAVGTQASGLTLGSAVTASIARYTVVASPNNSGTLMFAQPGMIVTVSNAGSNSMNLFPNVGDAVNSLSANVAFALPSGKTAALSCAVAGQWHAVLSA